MSKKIHVRPGRGQSKVGFVVGLLFCAIGLFVVIPIFGPFGIIWTAMAGIITFVNFRNGFTDKQIDSHVIDIEGDGNDITVTKEMGFGSHTYNVDMGQNNFAGRTSGQEDVETRLKKLQSLYDQALITREEYEAKKKDILEEL